MPATETYASPFILDMDMSENIEDQDFDFFDHTTPYIASANPDTFLGHDPATQERNTGFGSPQISQKLDSESTTSFLQRRTDEVSPRSPDSAGESFHDSSSDSSAYKRKSSSESSRSAFTGKDVSMNDADMGDWKVEGDRLAANAEQYSSYPSAPASSVSTAAYDFSDKIMENDFDFDSAASSPSHFLPAVKSPVMPGPKYGTPSRSAFASKSRGGHQSAPSQSSITQSMHGLTTGHASREVSPLSAMIASHESSPSAFFHNSPSPTAGVEFISGTMLTSGAPGNTWPANYDFGLPDPRMNAGFLSMPVHAKDAPIPTPFATDMSNIDNLYKPVLTIHPTPLKSRVETQIPIKMTLFPLPPGVTKLHLPTHTISKPKLLAKPLAIKSPDTLELTTTLVCTSAMQNPEFRRRAFARAAGTPTSPEPKPEEGDAASEESDENKPLNGGEVKICAGCITRERKRAARKKVKKVEEEESWHKDEDKRVIVFNTHEVKDWQQPSSQVQSDSVGDRREPLVPEGAVQVDAPMRIACYCRHQNEKLGFQVIFTIKDWTGHLVAQEITSSIMITDDHKTHNIPQLAGQSGNAVDGQTFLSNAALYGSDMSFEMPIAPFRTSHSSSDLQNLQRNYSTSYPNAASLAAPQPSHIISSSLTSRNVAIQSSPSGTLGPSNKKRKSSGSSKVPSGLAMTRLETTQPYPGGQGSGTAAITAASSQSPFTTTAGNFTSPNDGVFNQVPPSVAQTHPQFNTGPPTPNSNDQVLFSNNRSQSMDNLAMQQLYSAPVSTHPSRAPSPNSLRNSVQAYQQQQAQIAQAVANGLYGMPLSLNPHRPPTIHKMIPNEGPKAGGIEVTCLGSGFCQGLEVMFGDVKATTTTYWGETSLVCLLPPATVAGTVAVTFKHQHQQQLQPYPSPPIPKQQAFFKYVDDDEQQIIRTALSVLGHKMTGRMEDVRDLARRIVGDGPSSWGATGGGQSPIGGTSQLPVSGFKAATFGIDVEGTLLRILDLIDLDDSPHLPRFNLRRASGQTMLHLACALGLHRFVAALLARGANPDPRDKGGFTPMHFAAMHNHPQIVRRLILSGADPTWRTLKGYTASDLCVSDEALRSTRRVDHHSRRRSGGSIRSRTSSATSLRSLWEPSTMGMSNMTSLPQSSVADSDSGTEDIESDNDDDDDETTASGTFWMRPRRRSVVSARLVDSVSSSGNTIGVPSADSTGGALVSPAAAMTAVREHFAAQFQQIQQSMLHLNLPQMPTLPDYQAYLPTAPMVRRISSLVPHIGAKSASPGQSPTQSAKETDSKWWDLFSGPVPSAPPAYEDIYPQDLVVKRSSAEQAAADTLADNKCSALFDNAASSSTGHCNTVLCPAEDSGECFVATGLHISEEDQAHLELVNTAKVRFRSDRKLFFIWIPILLIIVAAMLYNRLPQLWAEGEHIITSIAHWQAARVVEV